MVSLTEKPGIGHSVHQYLIHSFMEKVFKACWQVVFYCLFDATLCLTLFFNLFLSYLLTNIFSYILYFKFEVETKNIKINKRFSI